MYKEKKNKKVHHITLKTVLAKILEKKKAVLYLTVKFWKKNFLII